MASPAKAFEWFGFHKLLRRVVFEGVVTNVEPLRIGAGRGAAFFEPVDLVVLKIRDANGREYPLIPGSSWKGAIRNYVVKLMRSAGLNVCDGTPPAGRYTCLRGNEFEYLESMGATPESIIESIANGNIRICLACMIFGTPSIASHARFFDSYPVGGSYRLGYRTMVAIDRRTGAAKRGALFTVEYVEPGARFGFRIEFLNLPNYAIGAIAEALLDMDMGLLKIGGLKTRGFGWVRIEHLEIHAYDYINKTELREEVPGLDPIDRSVKIVNDWRTTLSNFVDAWRNAVAKLKKASDNGWRWIECLE